MCRHRCAHRLSGGADCNVPDVEQVQQVGCYLWGPHRPVGWPHLLADMGQGVCLAEPYLRLKCQVNKTGISCIQQCLAISWCQVQTLNWASDLTSVPSS